MIVVTEEAIVNLIGQYVYPLFRYAAFFMAAPIFSTRVVSTRIRLVLSIAITIIVVPILPQQQIFDGLSLSNLLVVVDQVLIGLSLGFALQVVFQLFVLSGQYMAMKMGLGFASMNDPSNGVSVTVLSQFYLLTATLLFLSINGHLEIISVLTESFSLLPVYQGGLSIGAYESILQLGSWMFSGALTIALPVITALLLVNIAFGIVNRAAPQMNIFAVGFPITLLLGLLVMWIGFPAFLDSFLIVIDQGIQFCKNILELR